MPNTKSAERRMRSSARKEARNHATLSFLKKLEKQYGAHLEEGGKKDKAPAALRDLCSALDKAVKAGVLKRATVDRKKSRLTLRLNRAK
ncbi:MAG: 30S ribosomal protein S20 [Verrucomicrobia bacterium]|nr:30S ribosomal protein S20 [Verrucomicrobiota bacterium]